MLAFFKETRNGKVNFAIVLFNYLIRTILLFRYLKQPFWLPGHFYLYKAALSKAGEASVCSVDFPSSVSRVTPRSSALDTRPCVLIKKFICFQTRLCLVPVRHISKPSRSMHNSLGPRDPKRIGRAEQ